MIETFSVLTLTLARTLGIFTLVVAIAAIRSPKRFDEIMAEFARSPALTFVTGVFTLALGLTLAVLHTSWLDPLAIAVTLFGWAVLLKGVVLLVMPRPILAFAARADKPGRVRLFAIVGLILGVLLLVAGFIGRATVGL